MDTATAPDATLPPLDDLWAQVFEIVRKRVDVATVWLAMQAVSPLTVDGSYFVAALPADMRFLATNLENNETSVAIETALQEVTGRILAFHLVRGETLEDWEQEKATGAVKPLSLPSAAPRAEPTPVRPQAAPVQQLVPQAAPLAPPSNRDVAPSWEKLDERLAKGYKAAPLIKYPHGQARYLLECVQAVSDTMDLLMPPGAARDEMLERSLAKTLDRLGQVLGQLDPIFISLELLRYRRSQGRDIGV